MMSCYSVYGLRLRALQDHMSDEDEENRTGEHVTSQPASSIPMLAPTEKTHLQETGPVPSYGGDQ